MRRILFAACATLLCVQAHACPMADWLTKRYGISFSGFDTAIPAAAAEPDQARGGPYVRVLLRDAVQVADGFRHAVLLDVTSNKAWILRTGGFIGVREWYGPVEVGDASLARCRIEKGSGGTRAQAAR